MTSCWNENKLRGETLSNTDSFKKQVASLKKEKRLVRKPQWPYNSGLCEVCGVWISGFHKFIHHLSLHSKRNECKLCAIRFNRLYRLKEHMLMHRGKEPYKCDYCDESFLERRNWVSHMKKYALLMCKICGKDCNPLSQLEIYNFILHAAGHGMEDNIVYSKHLANASEIEEDVKIYVRLNKMKQQREGIVPVTHELVFPKRSIPLDNKGMSAIKREKLPPVGRVLSEIDVKSVNTLKNVTLKAKKKRKRKTPVKKALSKSAGKSVNSYENVIIKSKEGVVSTSLKLKFPRRSILLDRRKMCDTKRTTLSPVEKALSDTATTVKALESETPQISCYDVEHSTSHIEDNDDFKEGVVRVPHVFQFPNRNRHIPILKGRLCDTKRQKILLAEKTAIALDNETLQTSSNDAGHSTSHIEDNDDFEEGVVRVPHVFQFPNQNRHIPILKGRICDTMRQKNLLAEETVIALDNETSQTSSNGAAHGTSLIEGSDDYQEITEEAQRSFSKGNEEYSHNALTIKEEYIEEYDECILSNLDNSFKDLLLPMCPKEETEITTKEESIHFMGEFDEDILSNYSSSLGDKLMPMCIKEEPVMTVKEECIDPNGECNEDILSDVDSSHVGNPMYMCENEETVITVKEENIDPAAEEYDVDFLTYLDNSHDGKLMCEKESSELKIGKENARRPRKQRLEIIKDGLSTNEEELAKTSPLLEKCLNHSKAPKEEKNHKMVLRKRKEKNESKNVLDGHKKAGGPFTKHPLSNFGRSCSVKLDRIPLLDNHKRGALWTVRLIKRRK